MSEQILKYMTNLFQTMPSTLYEGLLLGFFIATVLMYIFKGFKKSLRATFCILSVEYVLFIFCSTFLFRTFSIGRGHNFTLGWSYSEIQAGGDELIIQNMMNVLAFVPIGIMLFAAFRTIRWWHVLLIGCGISVTIETLQYFFHRGFAEVDDVMHNTFGCILGYILVHGSWFMIKSLKRKIGGEKSTKFEFTFNV